MELTRAQEKAAFENFYLKHGFNSEQARAIVTFFGGEVDSFDESLKELYKTSKRAAEYRLDFHGHFYIPFETSNELKQKINPLRLMVYSKKSAIDQLSRRLKRIKGPEPKDACDFLSSQKQELKEFEEIVDYADNYFPQYAGFLEKLFNGILERVDQRRIITLEEYEMSQIEVRNEIYRNALTTNHWALGFELGLVSKISSAVCNSNAKRKEMYDSLPKGLRSIVDQQDYTVFYPEPLGRDEQKAGFAIKVLANEDPKEFEAIKKAINQHFVVRLKQIL